MSYVFGGEVCRWGVVRRGAVRSQCEGEWRGDDKDQGLG